MLFLLHSRRLGFSFVSSSRIVLLPRPSPLRAISRLPRQFNFPPRTRRMHRCRTFSNVFLRVLYAEPAAALISNSNTHERIARKKRLTNGTICIFYGLQGEYNTLPGVRDPCRRGGGWVCWSVKICARIYIVEPKTPIFRPRKPSPSPYNIRYVIILYIRT